MFSFFKKMIKKKKSEKDMTEKEKLPVIEEKVIKKKPKIFVLGSNHAKAVKCYEWCEPFDNLADCDILVVNLTTFNYETAGKVYERGAGPRVKRDIYRLLKSGGEVYCIIQPSMTYHPDKYNEIENYNYKFWSPIVFNVEEERGDIINFLSEIEKKKHIFSRWFENITSWTMVLRSTAGLGDLETLVQGDDTIRIKGKTSWGLISFAESKYKAVIAGSAYFRIGEEQDDVDYSGFIHLLPPPTNVNVPNAIDDLLFQILGEVDSEKPFPDWVNEIWLPGESNISEVLGEKKLELNELDKNIKKIKMELSDLQKYKALLFEKGASLGTVVREAFCYMNFDISKYEENEGDEDLIIKSDRGEAIIETKGMGNKSVSLADLRQLSQYVDDAIFKGRSPRGILIGNPYCIRKLAERELPFPDNVIEFAIKREIILLTSVQLFEILCKYMKKELTYSQILAKLYEATPVMENF